MDPQPLALELGPHRGHSKGPGAINSCLVKVSGPAGGRWADGAEGRDMRNEKREKM